MRKPLRKLKRLVEAGGEFVLTGFSEIRPAHPAR